MNLRRQRVAWLLAVAVVAALASAPSLLTAFADEAPAITSASPTLPEAAGLFSGDLAGLVHGVPEAIRGLFSGFAPEASIATP